MIILRCTGRLVKASKVVLVDDPPASTAPLGEWYANVLHLPFRGRSLVLFVHNPSRLAIVAPGRTLRPTLPVFRVRLPRLLSRLGVPEPKIRRQQEDMEDVVLAATVDRSLLGSMTDMARCLRLIAERVDGPAAFDPDMIEDYLVEMPSLAAGHSPDTWIRENLVFRTLR
jgi:hypothetical protein